MEILFLADISVATKSKLMQGRIQPTNLTVSQPANPTVSPEVGPHPNTNSNTNRIKI